MTKKKYMFDRTIVVSWLYKEKKQGFLQEFCWEGERELMVKATVD